MCSAIHNIISPFQISPKHFWQAIALYHEQPQLINQKIRAAEQLYFFQVSTDISVLQDIIKGNLISEELNKLESIKYIPEDFLENIIKFYDPNVQLKNVAKTHLTEDNAEFYISIRALCPKSNYYYVNCLEFLLFDKKNNKMRCISVSTNRNNDQPSNPLKLVTPPFPYAVQLTSSESNTSNIQLSTNEIALQKNEKFAYWLKNIFLPKLVSFMEVSLKHTLMPTVKSLSLINPQEYCRTYLKLKEKYGKDLTQKWIDNKVTTDPQKYIYEDIAIASYLICLWKPETDINFIDCGCGNGLLVYLLNQEGYAGYGIDIRKRSIWDIYPDTTLTVKQLTLTSIFPECNWIIGNHSDEITPWIPAIAARSNCNLFLLPCCPYDFNGTKFQRINAAISVYADYLMYVKDIGLKCGFNIDVDKLRIPSTKRTCFVGRKDFNKPATMEIEEFIEEKINENCIRYRETKEEVRNCTQLEKSLISTIVKICFNKLLESECYIQRSNGDLWNSGGCVSINDLADTVPKKYLKQLKQEYGGLQTLLKNHRYIFDVGGGWVKIKLPVERQHCLKYINKPCWFHTNHPNGCLNESSVCGFNHIPLIN